MAALYWSFPDTISESGHVAAAVRTILAEAQRESLTAGASPATPVAERAFAKVILETLGGRLDNSATAVAEWSDHRGEQPRDLAVRYLGAVLGEFARHAADREAGTLVETGKSASDSAAITKELARYAEDLSRSAGERLPAGSPSAIAASWGAAVAEAFRDASRLPEVDS